MASAQFASKRTAEAITAADACLDQIQADLPRMHARMLERMAPATPADTALDSELRAYLRSVDGATRDAVLASDPRALRAAAFAPPGLSGLTPAAHARARDAYLQAHCPTELQAERDVEAGLALVKKARQALTEHVRDFIDLEAGEQAAKFAE
jgi:hypothetical protein